MADRFRPEGRVYTLPDGQVVEVTKSGSVTDFNLEYLARRRLDIRRKALLPQLVGLSTEEIAIATDPDANGNVKKEAAALREAQQSTDLEAIYVHARLPGMGISPWRLSVVGVGKAMFAEGRNPPPARPAETARNLIDLKGVYVEPSYQGKGIASAMVHFMLDKLMEAHEKGPQVPLRTRNYTDLNPRMAVTLVNLGFDPKDPPLRDDFGDHKVRTTIYTGPPAGEFSLNLEMKFPELGKWHPLERVA